MQMKIILTTASYSKQLKGSPNSLKELYEVKMENSREIKEGGGSNQKDSAEGYGYFIDLQIDESAKKNYLLNMYHCSWLFPVPVIHIIPPLCHFTILGQKNAQNMPHYYTVEEGKNMD